MKNFLLIIPARLKSTRLPNKLLLKIKGKEVLKYVWERCKKACHQENIVVATPDQKIILFCKKNNIKFIKTSQNCMTGTDRVIEISKKIKKDFYINVQGDEIFVSPKSIKKVINKVKFYKKRFIINAYTKIKDDKEFRSLSVPKLVMDKNNFLLYISRGSIPLNKSNKKNKTSFKQVCIYGYPFSLLNKIKKNKKTNLEKFEDIEILRFLENNIKIKMIKAEASKLAIDTRSDFLKAKKILQK